VRVDEADEKIGLPGGLTPPRCFTDKFPFGIKKVTPHRATINVHLEFGIATQGHTQHCGMK
jgi:hypothetical protein